MLTYGLVALGGALGSVARFWLGGVAGRLIGMDFPCGTILINIAGSFLIGLFAALPALRGGEAPRAFLMAGLCGGFTTFSAFSLQTVELLRDGQGPQAAANIGLSVAACVAATALGMTVAKL